MFRTTCKSWRIAKRALPLALCMVALGCGTATKLAKSNEGIEANTGLVTELARQSVTATVDTLALIPADKVSPQSDLAAKFARASQRLVGLPVTPLDVGAFLSSPTEFERFDATASLALTERARLMTENDTLRRELEAKGQLYEQEKATRLTARLWAWAKGTLGVGGLIALCLLCPAVIPIFGQFVGWLVSLFPPLARAVGVVSVATFNRVVRGIGEHRHKAKLGVPTMLDDELRASTSDPDKALIEYARRTQNV